MSSISGVSSGINLQAIQSAIQSGNTTSAQSAFTQLKTDLQNASGVSAKGHHGHHHHHDGGGSVTNADTTTTDPTSSTSTSSSSNTSTELLNAIQTDGSNGSTSVSQLA